MNNKLITDKDVIQMISSFSERGKGDVAPELVSNGSKVILEPPVQWYGVEVINNQNLSLDVSALTLDSPGSPKVYTFYLVLFTHVGTMVRWDSQFTWVNGTGAPVMEACRGYIYKVEVILDSGSHHKNPLVEFVDNECQVAIRPEHDFPIVYPPVSGVIITAKYNNDYQERGMLGRPPTEFPPSDDYYHDITDPELSYSDPGWIHRLFLKISANYIPSNKSIFVLFANAGGTVMRTVKMDPATRVVEIDTSIDMSAATTQFGYIITSSDTLSIAHISGWTKLGNF